MMDCPHLLARRMMLSKRGERFKWAWVETSNRSDATLPVLSRILLTVSQLRLVPTTRIFAAHEEKDSGSYYIDS